VIRKIGILAISGAFAQALNFFLLPIIANLYGPEEYGRFSRFFSYFQIVLPIAGFGLPLAIVLVSDVKEGRRVGAASIVASGLIAILIAADAASNYDYLLAFVVLFAAFQQIGYQWLTRTGYILAMSMLPLTSALLMNAARIFAGKLVGPTHEVLILATIGAYGVFAIITFAIARRSHGMEILEFNGAASLWQSLKKFSHFPKYRTPQVMINTFGRNLPVLFLSYFTTSTATGHFALANAALGAGVFLVGNAFSGVFYPRISRAVADKDSPHRLLRKTTLLLFCMALSLYAIVVFWGPVLFTIVFGLEWRQAGQFSQWMTPWFVMALAARPTTDAILALGLQKQFVIFEVAATVLRMAALAGGMLTFDSPIGAVATFSVLNAVLYSALIFAVHNYARK